MLGSNTFEDYSQGESYQSRGRTMTQSDIRMFIAATGSTHPNHVDREYCKSHPIFDDVVVHGVNTLGVADAFDAELITDDAALALSQGHDDVKYANPVYPEDTLSGEIEIVDKSEVNSEWGFLDLDFTLTNQHQETVLTGIHQILVARSSHPSLD